MTINELLEYAQLIGRDEDMDLVTAIFNKLVTTKVQVVNFTGF
jgi:hypothetical protein